MTIMVNFKLIIALGIIFGVVLVTTSPISIGEETDVTKMFTPKELEMARNAGVKDRELINGKTRGVSVEEMVKLYLLVKNTPSKVLYDDSNNDTAWLTTFEEMAKVCEIFAPQLKFATNVSSEQQSTLNELVRVTDHFPSNDQFLYLRTSICSYLSEPSVHEKTANSFDMKLVPYMEFRFWEFRNRNATGVELVNTSKVLCCIYKGRDNVSELKVDSTSFSSSNGKMSDFGNLWNEYKTANTSKSFEKLCDFLSATNSSDVC